LYVTQSKPVKVGEFNKGSQGDRVFSDEGKSVSLSASRAKTGLYMTSKDESRDSDLEFLGGIGDKDWVGDGKDLSRNYPQGNRVYGENGKSATLSANGGGLGGKTGLYAVAQRGKYTDEEGKRKDSMVLDATQREYIIRKLTPRECERLQTVPDDYTLVPHPKYKNRMMSNTQRYKMLGNGFTVDVIAHILSHIKEENN